MISYPLYDRVLGSFIMNTFSKEFFKKFDLRGVCSHIKIMSKLVIKTKQKLCKCSRTKKFKIENKNFHLGSIYWDSVGNWESCSWDSGWEWEQIESQQIFWLKNGQTLWKHSKISTIFSFLLVFKIFNLKRLYFHRYY